VVPEARCTSPKPPTDQTCNAISCGPYCQGSGFGTVNGTCPEGPVFQQIGSTGWACAGYDMTTGNGYGCSQGFWYSLITCADGSLASNQYLDPGFCSCAIIIP
jgi:hypothetical protein